MNLPGVKTIETTMVFMMLQADTGPYSFLSVDNRSGSYGFHISARRQTLMLLTSLLVDMV